MAAKNLATVSLSPARQSLRETLDAQQRARAIVGKAQQVVDAATAALEHARAEAAKYDEAHEDVVRSRLAALKGERAKSPDEIREHRRARLISQEDVKESEQVLEVAKKELAEAQGNVARSERVTSSATTSVLSESVTAVISDWEKISAERERVRVILNSLILANVHLDALPAAQQANILHDAAVNARLPYGDAVDWKSLQNKVGNSLSRNFSQADPAPSIAKARAFWAKYAGELLSDPAAELPPLPGASELF
jgi:hypothetical protein